MGVFHERNGMAVSSFVDIGAPADVVWLLDVDDFPNVFGPSCTRAKRSMLLRRLAALDTRRRSDDLSRRESDKGPYKPDFGTSIIGAGMDGRFTLDVSVTQCDDGTVLCDEDSISRNGKDDDYNNNNNRKDSKDTPDRRHVVVFVTSHWQ